MFPPLFKGFLKLGKKYKNISVGFIKLVSTENIQIKSIKSEIIENIEVHTMLMEADGNGGKIMKMRKINNPQLVANKEVKKDSRQPPSVFWILLQRLTGSDPSPVLF